MHNLFVNSARRHAKEGVHFEVDSSLPSHEDAEGRAIVASLCTALQRLPAEQRSVLILVAYGYDYETIAAAEGIPIGTARSRLWRGRDHLRQLFPR